MDGNPRSYQLRSTFVIDKKGVVRHILREANPRAHVEEVLEICKEMNARHHAN